MAGRKYSNQTPNKRQPDVMHGDYSMGKTLSAAGEVLGYTATAPFRVLTDTVTGSFGEAMRKNAIRARDVRTSVNQKMTPIPGWDRK